MQSVLIYVTVILVAGCLFAGTKLTRRLPRIWLWSMLSLALIVYAVLLLTQVEAWLISDIAVLLVAILGAAAIGTTLSTSSALIVFCIAAGLVDFFSFSGGLTAKIIADYETGQNLLLQYLSISVPLPGRITPLIGIGDLIILGSVYYALQGLGHNGWRAYLVPLGGLLIALGVGLRIGGVYAIPFIGAATIIFLVMNRKEGASQTMDSAGSG